MCPMVSGNLRTHVTTYTYYADSEYQMHKWIVMCRFIDKKCLKIYTVLLGLCIC